MTIIDAHRKMRYNGLRKGRTGKDENTKKTLDNGVKVCKDKDNGKGKTHKKRTQGINSATQACKEEREDAKCEKDSSLADPWGIV